MQGALEFPRFAKNNAPGCEVSIEARLPAKLEATGHVMTVRQEYMEAMGRGQAILHNSKTKTNCAASDPRADGAAIPEPAREKAGAARWS